MAYWLANPLRQTQYLVVSQLGQGGPAPGAAVDRRTLVERMEEQRIEAELRKQQEFFELSERFRAAIDPKEINCLGDQLGRLVFGG